MSYVRTISATTGKFLPEVRVAAGGDEWVATAKFGVSVGTIFVTDAVRPAGVDMVFAPGSAGVEVRTRDPLDASPYIIPLWEMAPEEPWPVTDLPKVAIRGRAEFIDDELMGEYAVYVHGVAVFKVFQAIGEEYWREFDQGVFKNVR